jgi:hypothetical protein
MTEESSLEPNPKTEARPYHAAIVVGLYTGVFLVIVTLGSLVAANRIPAMERYALERNAVSYGLFLAIMLFPICRFLHRPLQMFVAGLTGWAMFVAAYNLAGWYFRNLFQVLRTPLEAFVEGAVVYGFCAVGLWVGAMLMRARHVPIAPGHERVRHAVTHDHRDSAW